MISETVDEVWHNFILFTPQYREFCFDVFGQFLYHQPNTSMTPLRDHAGLDFVRLYTQTFGDLPEIWGYEEGCSVPDLGDCTPSGWEGDDGDNYKRKKK